MVKHGPDKGLAGLAPLTELSDDAQRVNEELALRLKNLERQGFVDCKAMCSPDRNTSTAEKLWVLNNVLRIQEAGSYEQEIIEAMSKR